MKIKREILQLHHSVKILSILFDVFNESLFAFCFLWLPFFFNFVSLLFLLSHYKLDWPKYLV